jgi:hypothetical protein
MPRTSGIDSAVEALDLAKIETEANNSPTTGNLLELEITRNEKGVIIELKSEIFESFVRNSSKFSTQYNDPKINEQRLLELGALSTNGFWKTEDNKNLLLRMLPAGLQFDVKSNGTTSAVVGMSHNFLYDPVNDAKPNMSILGAVGLDKGVRILCSGLWSKEHIEKYGDLFKKECVSLHKKYLKTVHINYEITIKEIL